MIFKLGSTILDKNYLATRQYQATPISADFFKLVVNKPWGNEYLVYSNPSIEIWNLFIKHNSATSMHCHPKKKTSLVILDGQASFSSLNGSMELFPMDAVIIEAGTFHSTQAISKNGVRALEFETPPMKHDLVRLEDKYGRANEGYEGLEKMVASSGYFTRLAVHEFNIVKNVCGRNLCIIPVDNTRDMLSVSGQKANLAVIIKGLILSKHGDTLYGPTDIVHLEEFEDGDGIYYKDLQILTIKKDD